MKVDAEEKIFVQNAEMTRNPMYLAVGIIGLLALGKWWMTGKILGADTIVEEGFDADFEHSHFWK